MIKSLKELLSLMDKREKKRIILSVVLSFFEYSLLFTPLIFAYVIIDKIVRLNHITQNEILLYTTLMIISLVIRIVLRFYSLRLRGASGYVSMCSQRRRLGKDLRDVSMGYFSEKNLGDLVSTITSDAMFVEIEGMGVVEKVSLGIPSLITGLLILFYFEPLMALAVFGLLIPIYFAGKYIANTQDRLNFNRSLEIATATEESIEFIKGLQVLKTYNMTDKEFYKTKKAFSKLKKLSIKFELSHIPPTTLFQLGFRIITAIIILLSALFMISGKLNFPQMFLLMVCAFTLFGAVELMGVYNIFSGMSAKAFERMNNIKNIPKLHEKSGKQVLDKYDVIFKNVDFAYEKKPILKNISFNVPENTTTALVGLSGSGKTTITNLIARFWDVSKGEVSIGGKNIQDIEYNNLLQSISFVFQSVFLFDDTVFNNILIGRPTASYQEVVEMAKKARCHDFITKMDNGYETVIGEEGVKLSGGEKQRISIARALLKNAPIVLLDEVTANVDVENEMYIQMALSELLKDKTVVMIAHNLTTIQNADQILVIDKGDITESGTHNQLIDHNGIYKGLWDLQESSKNWNI